MQTKKMLEIYAQGRTGVQVGDNNNIFDFTYVGNVAHAHLLAASLLLASATGKTPTTASDDPKDKVDGEAFFITNDSPVYFWDYCRAVWRAAGSPKGTEHVWVMSKDVGWVLGGLSEIFFSIVRKPPTFTRQRIVYSTMTRYYNIGKARRVLGYKPRVALGDAVNRTVKWFMAQEAAP